MREAMRLHVQDEEFNGSGLLESDNDIDPMATWEATMARVDEQLDYLVDVDYEDKIRGRLKRVVRHYFGILNVVMVYSQVDLENDHFHDLLDQAMDDDLISRDEDCDLVLIDFVLMGQTPNEESVYVVIESSVAIDEYDVDRAARRARTLQTASGVVTRAAVIGKAVSDANRQRAIQNGVAVIVMAE